jgi:hypothetical protein
MKLETATAHGLAATERARSKPTKTRQQQANAWRAQIAAIQGRIAARIKADPIADEADKRYLANARAQLKALTV